jgi:hypothetical protein
VTTNEEKVVVHANVFSAEHTSDHALDFPL